jgi:CHAD domain-containing protein
MQDHLGDLNDADVAGRSLQQFVANYEDSQAGVQISERRSIDRVIQYMAYRSAEKHRLMVDFPQRWELFNREEVRRDLALSVAAL